MLKLYYNALINCLTYFLVANKEVAFTKGRSRGRGLRRSLDSHHLEGSAPIGRGRSQLLCQSIVPVTSFSEVEKRKSAEVESLHPPLHMPKQLSQEEFSPIDSASTEVSQSSSIPGILILVYNVFISHHDIGFNNSLLL